MKRLVTILFACLCCSVFGAKAQSHMPDGGLLKDLLNTIVDTQSEMTSNTPRYKMYKTTHDYILLKLDTATGKVWMVQIGMGDKSSRKVLAVDDKQLIQLRYDRLMCRNHLSGPVAHRIQETLQKAD